MCVIHLCVCGAWVLRTSTCIAASGQGVCGGSRACLCVFVSRTLNIHWPSPTMKPVRSDRHGWTNWLWKLERATRTHTIEKQVEFQHKRLPKFNLIFNDSNKMYLLPKHQNKAKFRNLDDSAVISSDFPGFRTFATSMTSTASTASVASMTSTASFHQKNYW